MQDLESRSDPRMPPPSLACPRCDTPWRGRLFCPQDGCLRETGVVVGQRYTLERLLGAGGMGFVYAARHKLLGKPVALKLLRAELCTDADQVGRFLREAQLCSRISHENIVDITDFGRDASGHLYLVMELLNGTTLAEVLAKQGPMPVKRALGILRQLCRALSCAHAASVVHRDLNPRNISLVEASGRTDVVKLLDFGISRLAGGQDRVTSTGVAVGTTPYMPPEQLRGEATQERQVDIYALGVIAHELLTGRLPFNATNPAQMIAEKLTGPPANLRDSALGQTSPALADVISESLAGDPRQRPASAAEVEQRLLSSGGIVSEPDEDLVGVRAGSYRLVRLVGTGGLGSVWLGEHPVIGSRVAIKILHAEMCESDEAVRRFVVEGQAVNRVDSAHIVKTFDFGKLPDGRDYAVMELLEGETLADRLSRGGRQTWAETRSIVLQLLRGLVSAHRAGIVHRDLKPENIHLGADPEAPTVKVLDFGIAKLLDADIAATHRTKLGVCMGTPLYAAPEQVAGQAVGPPADLYALGAVLYEMLVGQPPFLGSIQEVFTAKMARTAPACVGPDVPGAVTELVAASLGRSPDERPSAHEALSCVLQASASPACIAPSGAGVAQAPPGDALAREPARGLNAGTDLGRLRPRWVPVGVFAVLLALTSVALWLVVGGSRPAPEQPAAPTTKAPTTKAEPLFLEVLETSKRVLGDDHADTQPMNNLAILYRNQARYDEAESLLLEALETSKRVRGDDHPDTLGSTNNLANLYVNQGRYDEAEPLLLEALETSKRVLGDDHPYTASTLYNLACLEVPLGNGTKAMDWLRQSVDAGWANADLLGRDSDLESLHGPEFDALVEQARRNAAAQRGE